jgi:thiamine-monophosphate kinase
VCTLAGGDDYELVFTASPSAAAAVAAAAREAGIEVTCIGRIERERGLRLLDRDGGAVADTFGSFDHFHAAP